MARQNNEDPALLQGSRKSAATRTVESVGGGKWVLVNEQARQSVLNFESAENPAAFVAGVDGGAAGGQTSPAPCAAPQSKSTTKRALSATMEEVIEHLHDAFRKVASNKGAPGPDGKSIDEVRKHQDVVLAQLVRALRDGTYAPGEIRRVWIPKGGGGQRGLGVPNVVDRIVGEAVRQVLEPLYEPTFRPQSHGFRPGRSCHTAITDAVKHVEQGYELVVDLDLEKFFDRVHHQRLLARLSERVEDRRVLTLIQRMLKAKVVMPEGVLVSTEEGVPQGGPLSPLLSNIVLDELDTELVRRGHRFVRYADDLNVYVRTERAGKRVMASITRFIERRLRLKVNEDKSAVARTGERHFVGFRLKRKSMDGEVEVLLSERSKRRIDEKIRELTPRNWGGSLRRCIEKLNVYTRGWIGFFRICTDQVETTLRTLDSHIRRRLRAIQLKQWKRKRTIARRLIARGVKRTTAWRRVYQGRKSLWVLSHDSTVDRALRNAYFAARGFEPIADLWRARRPHIGAPVQLVLPLG